MRRPRLSISVPRIRFVVAAAMAVLLGTTPAWALTAEEEAKLLASDGAYNDRFGFRVALQGDMAVIGARNHVDNILQTGSAYVFTRTAGVWAQQAELLASDGWNYDRFGQSVALDGDTALIGAPGDDAHSGSAYVFTHNAGVWTEQAKLVASDGDSFDNLGDAVALDGDTALIGAKGDDEYSGSAYVFTRTGGVWTEQAKLLPADGAVGDWFGQSVAIDGDTALIGAFQDDDNDFESGSAYVFTRTGGTWTQQAKLLPADGTNGDYFGYSVAVDGDTAVIGARCDADNGAVSGSAYVFTRTGGTWTQQAKLLASDGAAEDVFGKAVALDGDTALIGAAEDGTNGNGDGPGSAYVFTRRGGVWTEQVKLLASDGAAKDVFGESVALDGDTALIGAPKDDDNGDFSGSAYVFRLYDDDAPAVGGTGIMLLLLAVLGSGAYFMRRRRSSPVRHHSL